jgi:hypothetical protein
MRLANSQWPIANREWGMGNGEWEYGSMEVWKYGRKSKIFFAHFPTLLLAHSIFNFAFRLFSDLADPVSARN